MLEPAAVGGERQLLEAAAAEVARQTRKQPHDVAAHERLAAGDPQLVDPAGDKGGGDPVDLLQRQQVAAWQELHALRHAIGAAKVAAIRHRHPQIGDGAVVAVLKR